MTDIRESIHQLIQGILAGQILETFERFYDDDVVMSENRIGERVGKAANRKSEEFFVNNFKLHSVNFGKVIIEGEQAAIESSWEMTFPDGNRVFQHQVSIQTWRAGKIIREDFYHG